MLLNAQNSQVVLIDFQPKLLKVIDNNSAILANTLNLAKAANLFNIPIIATQQNSEKLGEIEPDLNTLSQKTINKTRFSAATEEVVSIIAKNAQQLNQPHSTIIICGIEAHICVLQTAIELVEQDFDVCIVTDCCSSRSVSNRDAAFDRMAYNGVELVTSEMVLFEWLRDYTHPHFKAIQQLIK